MFDTLQEKFERHIPNDKYEIIVTAHIKTAVNLKPFKPRPKNRFNV